ncbi:MAG: hypothetical protein QXJ20_02685 [Candidatus Aenigmatarchaeota archaeon]
MTIFNLFNIPDFSIFIVLGGAILLYFGKIIGDTKVEKYDKLSYYIEGLLFSAFYLFLPIIFSIYVIENLFKIPNLWAVVVQMIIVGCLSWTITAHNLFRRYGLVEVFKKKIRERFKELSEKSIVKWAIKKEDWFKSKFGIDYVELNLLAFYIIPIKFLGRKDSLFIFSFITLLSLLSVYVSEINLLVLSFSSVFTILSLTMIALAYGFSDSYYPPAKLYLEDGKVIEGNILKFGEFIYLVNDEKKIFVNSNKVTKIEESLWKGEKVT